MASSTVRPVAYARFGSSRTPHPTRPAHAALRTNAPRWQPLAPVGPVQPAHLGAPVSLMDTRLADAEAEARAERARSGSAQLRTLLLFFAFWVGSAVFFLGLYLSRLA